jgi:hypothetical protein
MLSLGRIYKRAIADHALPRGVAFVALDQLGHAFAAMAAALRTQGASHDDFVRFQEAIETAINEAHGLNLAERLAALNTLFTAFDGKPRHVPMTGIRADFLSHVRLTEWNAPPPLASDGGVGRLRHRLPGGPNVR